MPTVAAGEQRGTTRIAARGVSTVPLPLREIAGQLTPPEGDADEESDGADQAAA